MLHILNTCYHLENVCIKTKKQTSQKNPAKSTCIRNQDFVGLLQQFIGAAHQKGHLVPLFRFVNNFFLVFSKFWMKIQWVSLTHPPDDVIRKSLTDREMHRRLILKVFWYCSELMISLSSTNLLCFQKHFHRGNYFRGQKFPTNKFSRKIFPQFWTEIVKLNSAKSIETNLLANIFSVKFNFVSLDFFCIVVALVEQLYSKE